MKTNNIILKTSLSLAVLLAAQTSFAGGTEADTDITNTATLSYSVGGAVQTALTSTAVFEVDKKVDLIVNGLTNATAGNILQVAPGSTGNDLKYSLTNTGNSTQDFKLSFSHLSGAGTDFDAGTQTAPDVCTYTVSPAAVPASASYAFSATPIVTLAKDAVANITLTCAIQTLTDVTDGDVSEIDLLATAVDTSVTPSIPMTETGGVGGVDRVLMVDVVLADGDAPTGSDTAVRNAMYSAVQTYEVNTPLLSLEKSSVVLSDLINGNTNPKRIPGAIVEYTIKIENNSDAEATGVDVTDVLAAVQSGYVEFLTPAVGTAVQITGSTVGSAQYDSGTFTVTASGLTIPAETAAGPGVVTVTFQVKIL